MVGPFGSGLAPFTAEQHPDAEISVGLFTGHRRTSCCRPGPRPGQLPAEVDKPPEGNRVEPLALTQRCWHGELLTRETAEIDGLSLDGLALRAASKCRERTKHE